MTDPSSQLIKLLPTHVRGLDEVLGGGLPEYSFNLIAGAPGTGKTTLAQQIVFSRATEESRAMYFTVLGEPPLKMMRQVQQYSFFDAKKLDRAIRFVNLSAEAAGHDIEKVLQRIQAEVESFDPSLVVVDSFRTVARTGHDDTMLQEFVQRLAMHLTSWQATTFLVGEYEQSEPHTSPVFTVADGIIWLTQAVERSSSVRRLQVMKLRAAAPKPGLHTMLISRDGVRVFPRAPGLSEAIRLRKQTGFASTGIEGLDAMMKGGIPRGATALVVGPSGSGKSVLARQFVAAGASSGETCVLVVFEEHANAFSSRAESFGPALHGYVEKGSCIVLSLRPLDLTVDETLSNIAEAVQRSGATRLAIDSLSGFELTLAPSFREDFRESLFRLVHAVNALGVTVLMTAISVVSFTDLGFSPHIVEFLADVLILQRYVEIDGRLERAMAVVKMRDGTHDPSIRRYVTGRYGISVGEVFSGYRSVLTGVPVPAGPSIETPAGLTVDEAKILMHIRRPGGATMAGLKAASGLSRAALSQALARLETLKYATKKKVRRVETYVAE